MRKSIVILTATRAEYGLLSPIIRKLSAENDIHVRVAVTGMHLSPEFGYTYQEIEKDGIEIDRKIEILMGSDTAAAMSKTMGLAMISFAEYFDEAQPDALLVLGDRYETLAVCCAAMNARIPIIHLHGGETTEGAIDEAIRHSITKMSYLHFTSTESYRRRVIQLGEHPDRVYNIGAMGVENVLKTPLLSRHELEGNLGIKPGKSYCVVTYHPVTLDGNRSILDNANSYRSDNGSMDRLCDGTLSNGGSNELNDEGLDRPGNGGLHKPQGGMSSRLGGRDSDEQIRELLSALDQHSDMYYIITKANADAGGRRINCLLEDYARNRENVRLFDSLGTVRYLSAIKYCCMAIGNSSSGIIEVPSFGVPTVNIGDRQKGRLRAESVIDCSIDENSVVRAIGQARSKEFADFCRNVRNPYEGTDTSGEAVRLIREKVLFAEVEVKKKFYDIAM